MSSKKTYKIVPPTTSKNYYVIMGKDEDADDKEYRYVDSAADEEKANQILNNLNQYGTALSPEQREENRKKNVNVPSLSNATEEIKTNNLSAYERNVKDKKWSEISDSDLEKIKEKPETTNADIKNINKEIEKRKKNSLDKATESGVFDTKNESGQYEITNNELIELRNKEKKGSPKYNALQKEINRRFEAGEAPEFGSWKEEQKRKAAAKKEAEEAAKVAAEAEKSKEKEEVVEEPKPSLQENISLSPKDEVKKDENYWNRILFGNDKGSTNKKNQNIDGKSYSKALKEFKDSQKQYDSLYDEAKKLQDSYNKEYKDEAVPTDDDIKAAENALVAATTDEEKQAAQNTLDRLNAHRIAKDKMDNAIQTANSYKDGDYKEAKAFLRNFEEQAKENKEAKKNAVENFLKSNPSVLEEIFGSNSGANLGERASMLASIVANLGANFLRGVRTKGTEKAIEPKVVKMLDNAANKAMERTQNKFDQEADYEQKLSNIETIMDSQPYLGRVAKTIKDKLGPRALSGKSITEDELFNTLQSYSNDLSEDELESCGLRVDGFNPDGSKRLVKGDNFKNFYDDFDTVVKTSALTQANQKTNTEIEQAKENLTSTKLDNVNKALKNDVDRQDFINEINDRIRKLEEQKDKIRSSNATELIKIVADYAGVVAGANTYQDAVASGKTLTDATEASKSKERAFHEGFETSGSGNVGVVKLNVKGSFSADQTNNESTTNSKQNTDTTNRSLNNASDVERMKAIREFQNGTLEISGTNISEISADLENWRDTATKLIDEEINNLKTSRDAVQNKMNTPSDIRTKDVITISNGSDKAYEYQCRLGYCKNKKINKDFNYYLTKLRG